MLRFALMQLLRASEVPVTYGTPVFHYSRLRAVLLLLLLFGFGVACIAMGRVTFTGVQRYVSYYIGAMLLICLLLLREYFAARFRVGNWLARVSSTGVFLKFRSYLNDGLPACDNTVVYIPYDEIRSVGLLSERIASTDTQGQRVMQTVNQVEINVAADVEELARAISVEQAKRAPKERRWYATTSTLFSHYPVRAVPPSTVRVEWGVVPGRKAFLDMVRTHVHITSPTTIAEDYTTLETLTRDEQLARLRELDAGGNTVAAVATARRLYGYDLATAKMFVESLRGKTG
jgi:hypothetical protein